MNYFQFNYHLFPTKIFKEDRDEYILVLRQSQEDETNQPFLDFMATQFKKSLALEIERFKTSQKKPFTFLFWFAISLYNTLDLLLPSNLGSLPRCVLRPKSNV